MKRVIYNPNDKHAFTVIRTIPRKILNTSRNICNYCTFLVFNTRYAEMLKVQGAKCAISKLMYGLSVCTDDNHSLKLVAYRLVHTDEPYINLHL